MDAPESEGELDPQDQMTINIKFSTDFYNLWFFGILTSH